MIHPRTPALLLAGVVCLAWLVGCAPVEERPELSESRLEQARQSAEAGDYAEAARIIHDAARQAPPERRDPLLLQGAEWYLQAGDLAHARELLDQVRHARLSRLDAVRYDLAAAELALAQAATAEALALLPLDAAEVPPDLRARYHRLRAQALLHDGQPYQSALERRDLAEWLVEPNAVHANREALFSALLRLSPAEMERRIDALAPDDPMRGWLALAYQMRTRLFEGEPIDEALARWRQRHPRHPAGEVLADELVQRYQASFAYPEQVALLLPLTGRFESASAAIRDGFFTAWYEDTGRRPAIRVYDVSEHPQGAIGAYRQAVNAGAGLVVGPLDRANVESLLGQPLLTVPVLALNYVERERRAAPATLGDEILGAEAEDFAPRPAAPVYQFGLLPEHEARQAAQRLMSDGRHRALVLVPRDDWGDRMMQAFVDEYTGLGGYLTDLARYYPEDSDHSAVLRRLLALDESRLRARALEQLLGQSLEFVPQAREDTDALFIAARPEQARLIRPQLRFFDAGHLPVYATSHIYSGRPAPGADSDLDGILFCDAPWMLDVADKGPPRNETARLFPAVHGGGGRLFAIGADAYRLIPYLDWLTDHPGDEFAGLSGRLHVDDDLRIQRDLSWAHFRGGVPEPATIGSRK